MRTLILALPLLCLACSKDFFQAKKKETHKTQMHEEPSADAPVLEMSNYEEESVELKQAKAWAKILELEELVLSQQERIALLEEGFMLGINPQGKKPKNHKPLALKKESEAPAKKEHEKTSLAHKSESMAPTIDPNKSYEESLEKAKKLFEEGKYGNAYLEFSKLDQEFAESKHASEPKYWIGYCWLNLKEYQNAKTFLELFISQAEKSDLYVSAKFLAAKADLGLGLKSQARKRLKDIIKEHPYEENAESAKELLAELAKDV